MKEIDNFIKSLQGRKEDFILTEKGITWELKSSIEGEASLK